MTPLAAAWLLRVGSTVGGRVGVTSHRRFTPSMAKPLPSVPATGECMELVWHGRLAGEAVHDGRSSTARRSKQFIELLQHGRSSNKLRASTIQLLRWLPELTTWMNTVRLDHLVHHTSAYPDLTDPTRGVPGSNAQVVERFRALPALHIEPGAQFAYDDAGYVLLAERLLGAAASPLPRSWPISSASRVAVTRLGRLVIRLQTGPTRRDDRRRCCRPRSAISPGALQACNAAASGPTSGSQRRHDVASDGRT